MIVMLIKRSVSVFIAVLLAGVFLIPSSLALGRVVNEDYSFVSGESVTIGWSGYPVSVFGDGSFEYTLLDESIKVSYAENIFAFDLTTEDPYPVSVHSFSSDSLDYIVRQFASLSKNLGDIVIYSRVTVTNNADVTVDFPETAMGATAISKIPSHIKAGKSAQCDYAVTVKMSGIEKEEYMSYDNADKHMKEHWNSILSDILSFKTSEKKDYSHNTALKKAVIQSLIDSGSDAFAAFASPAVAKSVLLRGEDLYGCAVALMKTGDMETAYLSLDKMGQKSRDIADSLTDFDFYPGAKLIMRDGKVHLEDNLFALNQLWGYSYILRKVCETDTSFSEEYEAVTKSAEKLANDIYSLINDAAKNLSTDWESATVSGKKTMLLCGEDFSDARALCEWYIANAPFNETVSPELCGLAVNALDYYSDYSSPVAALNSFICQRGDSTLIIGRGAPVTMLSDKAQMIVENYPLSSGETVSCTVKVSKKEITVTIDTTANLPVQLEFSAFKNNIESASCGFDIESGIVTAPAGTTKITVKLSVSAKEKEEERAAYTALESILAKAYSINSDDCTTVSAEEFEKAFSAAKKARSADTESKVNCTKALKGAINKLSPMIAGYDHAPISADSPLAGSLTNKEIYQKFSLPKKGKVSGLFVKGDWSDGISAAVYTLRGDAYTTDVLLSESYGEKMDGGIFFDLDFQAEEDKIYVLCIFCEYGEVTLELYQSDSVSAHTSAMGETTVYKGAGLYLEFNVSQVDRSELDTYYNACMAEDVSAYTKESKKKYSQSLKDVKEILTTPSVTEEEYKAAYKKLTKAHDSLDTYASDDKVEEFPVASIVLICVVAVMLAGTFVSAVVTRKKSNT